MIATKEYTIENRTWRYATKKFDNTKQVSDEDMETLLEAIRLTASSYGLQPYKVYVITDQETKSKLRPVSWNQSQLEDASHILVFANQTDFGEELVDEYIENMSTIRNIPLENLKPYTEMMKNNLVGLPKEAKEVWTANQVYIALGNALQAAAELEIDTTPMEGFDSAEYNKILGLSEQNLNASVVLAVGYRSEEDATQHYAKVRKSKEELFTHI